MKKTNKLSLKDQFIKDIETMIISGKLQAGEKLPSERDLAKEMGISKTMVNSGILEMAQKGFLEIKARQGTYVKDYKKHGKLDVILSIMDYNYNLLSKKDVQSFFEMRFLLEQLALSSLVPNITDDQIKILERILDKMKVAKSNSQASKLNYQLHHEICYMSGNTISPLIFSSFEVAIINVWIRYCEVFGREQMVNNAEEIFDSIKQRNAAKSIQVLQNSLNKALEKM